MFPHKFSLDISTRRLSFLGELAVVRYGTFNDVYKRRWSDILKFRQRNLFTTCEVCFALKGQLNDKSLSMEQKLGSLKLYRAHLHEQFCDRTIIWRLQSESSDPTTDILVISTDGLDQSKFALPREPELRNNAALNLIPIERSLSSFCFSKFLGFFPENH